MRILKQQTGFSLVELSVVLAVVGLLAIGSISLLSEKKTHVQWQESELKLKLVKKSLINYVSFNKFLLCPDDDNDGFEDRNANSTCSVSTGTVPFNNLDLSLSDVSDRWGNPFRYVIDRSATTLANMNDCPENSACFFNNIAPPEFNLTTLPVMGQPGPNNLRVCRIADCNAGTAGADIDGDDFIAVLIALNENGQVATGLDDAEELNRDSEQFFVRAEYSEAPYFDDLIQTISANELKKRFDIEIIEEQNTITPPLFTPNEVVNPAETGEDAIAGGTGDNDRFSDNIGVNVVRRTMEFEAENAGKMVTLTFNAKIEGGWEDAGANGGTAETNWEGKLETQDRFMVGLNGPDVSDLNGSLVNLEEGVDRFDEHQVTESFYYDENLDADNTWYETLSFDVNLDENGNLNLDLAVFSTHVSEKVTVSNIEAILYVYPPDVPNLPNVPVIYGIVETEGLN